MNPSPKFTDHDWWRSAVVYQVYPRSFADSNNDGIGDVAGVTGKLDYLKWLGVDAIWVSPWYPSPLWDGGYDVSNYRDIHPDYGTLDDADDLFEQAHARGLRVLIDLVPNHCSIDHPWFQAALAAGPGSPERELFVFREGRGDGGQLPPTNWGASFGGGAWERVIEADGTPGQWFLHMFAPEQPDWNWENPRVLEEFDAILRFWFDRGADGFRVDVADSLIIDQDFPDTPIDPRTGKGTWEKYPGAPFWDRPELAEIQRRWRRVADEYTDSAQGPRIFVSEAYLPFERMVEYVRADRLHTSFNFEFLQSEWHAESLRNVIDKSLAAHQGVGAPATWVLSNHDVIRPVSRYGKSLSGRSFRSGVVTDEVHWQNDMAGLPVDVALGQRRSRAAALLMMALPGGCYVYQGEELGLEEVEDLPEECLQDPIWFRSNHTLRGRDGCRVPIPWSGNSAPFGFGTDADPWLPQPNHWGELGAESQAEDPDSMLNLYRTALAERHRNTALGDGEMSWEESDDPILSFTREPGFRCVVNTGDKDHDLGEATVILRSAPFGGSVLPPNTTAWMAT